MTSFPAFILPGSPLGGGAICLGAPVHVIMGGGGAASEDLGLGEVGSACRSQHCSGKTEHFLLLKGHQGREEGLGALLLGRAGSERKGPPA